MRNYIAFTIIAATSESIHPRPRTHIAIARMPSMNWNYLKRFQQCPNVTSLYERNLWNPGIGRIFFIITVLFVAIDHTDMDWAVHFIYYPTFGCDIQGFLAIELSVQYWPR